MHNTCIYLRVQDVLKMHTFYPSIKVVFPHTLVACSESSTNYLSLPHNPHYQFIIIKQGQGYCNTCIHTYIHDNMQHTKLLVNTRMENSWQGNVKVSSLGRRGISLIRCRMFSVGGYSFWEVHPCLFSTINT